LPQGRIEKKADCCKKDQEHIDDKPHSAGSIAKGIGQQEYNNHFHYYNQGIL